MEPSDNSGYRVPGKRPFLLAELARVVPGVDDRVRHMGDLADPLEYEAVADRLWGVFVTARELAPGRSRTGCDIHPAGPVDPLAPEGWTRCLLCNRNRRIGDRSATAPRSAPPRTESLGFPVPGPPYTGEALRDEMRRINDLVLDLGYRSAEGDFAALAEAAHRAFVIAREMSRPRAGSGCGRHPGAPVDPTAPEGGPGCLFCRGEELRRGRTGPPVVRMRRHRPQRGLGRRAVPPPPGEPGPDGPDGA